MLLTILLAKVIGLYMLIAGLALFMNRRHMMLAIVAIAKERAAQLIGGLVALIFGLFIVNMHNDWSTLPASIITFIGWAGVVKGIFYLFVPEAKLTKVMHALADRKWFVIDGVVAILVGLYLAGFGFGWF